MRVAPGYRLSRLFSHMLCIMTWSVFKRLYAFLLKRGGTLGCKYPLTKHLHNRASCALLFVAFNSAVCMSSRVECDWQRCG